MRVFQAGEQLFGLNPEATPGTELRRTIVHRARRAAWEEPSAWPDLPNNCSTYSAFCLGQTQIRLVPGPLPRTIAWVLPQLPGSPEARTRTICPDPQAQHAKKGPSSSPSPDTPNNSPTPSPRIPASPRERSYMPDYGFIYYLLLSQPHHLMLALRFSFFALPYA